MKNQQSSASPRLLCAVSTASADVQLTMQNGRVSIVAKDATVRQILTEWARVGQTKIVNVERVPGGPMTLELHQRARGAGARRAAALAERLHHRAAPRRSREPLALRSHHRHADARGRTAGDSSSPPPPAFQQGPQFDRRRPPTTMTTTGPRRTCGSRRPARSAVRCSTRSRSRSVNPQGTQMQQPTIGAPQQPPQGAVPMTPGGIADTGRTVRRRGRAGHGRAAAAQPAARPARPGAPVRRPGGPERSVTVGSRRRGERGHRRRDAQARPGAPEHAAHAQGRADEPRDRARPRARRGRVAAGRRIARQAA